MDKLIKDLLSFIFVPPQDATNRYVEWQNGQSEEVASLEVITKIVNNVFNFFGFQKIDFT